jgi:hypothetical protein
MTNLNAAGRPSTVTWSFIIWLITVLLGIVGSIFIFILAGTGAAVAGAGGLAGAFIVAGIIGIIIAIVELLIVFKMRDGRNWARIVLLVLAILQVIGNATQGGNNNAVNWIGLIAVVVATVLMFLPASNGYFRGNRATAAA